MIDITLSEWEAKIGAAIGTEREIQYRFYCDWDHADGRRADVGWQTQVEGACGEVAAAKALGLYWPATVNTFKDEYDLADFEVRTRSKHHYGLLVRDNDPDDRRFILVTGECPYYKVWGWATAAEVRRHGTRLNPGNDGRPPFWVLDDKTLLHAFA